MSINTEFYKYKFFLLHILLIINVVLYDRVYAQVESQGGIARGWEMLDAQQAASLNSRSGTGIIHELGTVLMDISDYDGRKDARYITAPVFMQAWLQMRNGSYHPESMTELRQVREMARHSISSKEVKAGMLLYLYDRFDEEVSDDSQSAGNLLSEITSLSLATDTLFMVTPFRNHSYHGSDLTFVLDTTLMFTNFPLDNILYRVDFQDGAGFRSIFPGESVHFSYPAGGIHQVTVEAVLPEGDTLKSGFSLDVKALVTPDPDDTLHIVASTPYMGDTASGDGWVILAPGHTSVTNPIIIVEGFDIGDMMGWEELYAIVEQQGMLDTILAHGYDVIILNFDDPMSYIQANAFMLMELIDSVNGMISPLTELSVLGASMGGLVTRYALAWMETHGLDHNTRLYVSFDAPHLGANIPLGLQYWVEFFAGAAAEAQYMLDLMSEPSARQMLIYHYTDPPSTIPGSDPLFTQLINDYIIIGDYPVNLKKVAASNGSGTSVSQGFNPGAQIIDFNYSTLFGIVQAKGNVWAVPNNNYTRIFEGKAQNLAGLIPNSTVNVYVSGTKAYDNAPGGYRPTMQQLADVETGGFGDIVALYNNHCFIPFHSSFDINTTNVFYNANTDPNFLQKTPFDAAFYPYVNEEHIFIGPQMAQWFLSQVFEQNPSVRGKLYYADHDSVTVEGVHLELKNNSGTMVDSLSTGRNGHYRFGSVSAGVYSIEVNDNPVPGGFNANDALLVLRHFVGLETLNGKNLDAADTDGSGIINASDALLIAQRFVNLINTFPAGDWIFYPAQVTVGNQNVIAPVRGICVGDVNASYVP